MVYAGTGDGKSAYYIQSGVNMMRAHLFGRSFRLLRRMESRKNRVYLAASEGRRYVLKLYRSPHHLHSALEHQVMQQARGYGIPVPPPLAFIEGKALLMAYIPGGNLCDLLNSRCLQTYADKLAQWYSTFHRCFSRPGGGTLVRGDSNLRNFILCRSGILYGVDFEEASPGNPLLDIGQICASILDTEPMFTPEKSALCLRLITRYSLITGQGNLEPCLSPIIARVLRETASRRPRQQGYLLEQAGLLEKCGLASL